MSFMSPRRVRRPAARGLVAAACLALLLGVTGCGADDPDKELKTDGEEMSLEDWRTKIDDCMLDAGFDITPDAADGESVPSIDTSKFDMVEFDKAYAVCADEIGPSPVDETLPSEEEVFESQLVFAECMREAGYDYPDPVKGSGGMGSAFGPDINPDDVDACTAEAYDQVAPK